MRPLQRRAVLWSTWTTAGTGALHWWMDTMLQPVDAWAVVNHPLQPWVLKLHILAAPVLVFALGSIAVQHIWKHFVSRVGRGRRSGVVAGLVLAPMVVSGYLIQTIITEPWLSIVVWMHLATGTAFTAGLVAHQWGLARSRVGISGASQGDAPLQRRRGVTAATPSHRGWAEPEARGDMGPQDASPTSRPAELSRSGQASPRGRAPE